MQRAALRSIYSGGQPKTKHAAIVAPVLDTDEENPSRSDEDDNDHGLKLGQKRYTSGNNNWNTTGNVNRVPEAEEDEEAAAGIVLQKKSAQYEIPRLSALTGGPFSNQSQELHELYQQQQNGGSPPSGSAQKYTILGQKQKWRKSRAQRSRRLGQTISPVDDVFEAQGGGLDEEEDLENPSPPSSPRQSSSSYISVNERLDTQRSYESQGPLPPFSGRFSSIEGSQLSSRYDSGRSTGRSESSSTAGEEKQRFVVTRQKKSKYAARIHLPGQQNPLYLGRYKNEEAALAACESAYLVITTPRLRLGAFSSLTFTHNDSKVVSMTSRNGSVTSPTNGGTNTNPTTTNTSTAMRALPALPLPIFKHIVAFALYDYTEELMPRPMIRIPFDALRNLALVAKDWTSPIREILAFEKLSALTMALDSATRKELAEYKRRVQLRGRYIRDLTISMGKYDLDKEFFMRNANLHFVDDIRICWKDFFVRMPDLKRLDISKCPLSSPHLVAIVDAASTYCMDLQALILPGKERQDAENGDAVAPFVAKVYEAVERWYLKRGRGGLRQLFFPSRLDGDRLARCTKYIKRVVEVCPNVEYLDGYKHSLRELDRLTCHDAWIITKDTWELFNKTCVHLREFNWVVVPFKDDFFQTFGAYYKPQLTNLTFAVSMLWNWEMYFRECGETDRSAWSPHGIHAKDAKAALKACPALTHLEICFYHPVDEDILDNPMEMYEEEDYEFLVTTYPQTEVFNQDVFGDQFCISAAENCPLLERLSMWEVVERYNGNITPISTFTDRGLVALSKLKWLQFIELRTVNCSGNGLFVLLNNFPSDFSGQRDMQISLGGANSRSKLKFYKAVTQLLTLIIKSKEVKFVKRRVVLRLVNSSFAPVDHGWSKDYLQKLEVLIAEVKQKHPDIRLRCGIHGRKHGGFSGIVEFGLYTASSKPSMWYGWEDEDGQRSKDDVFISRGAVHDEYRDHHRELAVENLPLDYELDADYFDDDYGYGGGYGYNFDDEDDYEPDNFFDDNDGFIF